MTIHIQGPWRTDAAGGFPLDIHDQDGVLIARVQPSPAAHNVARRIVACVNACEGMPTEMLAEGGHGCLTENIGVALGEHEALQAQRDELLRSLPEWYCRDCNTVYPAPSGFDVSCPALGCRGQLTPSSQQLRATERQRDELLAALEDVVSAWEKGDDVFGGVQRARAAIAKAKGGAA